MKKMKTTPKTAATTAGDPRGVPTAIFPKPADPDRAEALARMALRPAVNAAVVVQSYAGATMGEQDVGMLVDVLCEGVRDIEAGDMGKPEAMLYTQAQALQAMFIGFARRAQAQEYQRNLDCMVRLALKAQNQCRMTLETLAAIKNPPVLFAKQANINNGGQQQVNNGTPVEPAGPRPEAKPAASRARNTRKTELLENRNGERLESRTTRAAGGADPAVAPVGSVDRTANRPR